MTVADVKRFVARSGGRTLRPARARGERQLTIGHGELGERERVLLSVAERAGAVRAEPGGPRRAAGGADGPGQPAHGADGDPAARNRGWEAYRSIERFSSDGQTCRRRQILDHFGDGRRARRRAAAAMCATRTRRWSVCCARRRRAPAARAARVEQARWGCAARVGRGRGGEARARGGSGCRGGSARPGRRARVRDAARVAAGAAEGKPAFTVAADSVLRALLRTAPERAPASCWRSRGSGRRSARSTASRCWRRWLGCSHRSVAFCACYRTVSLGFCHRTVA